MPRTPPPQGLERGWYATVNNAKNVPANPFPGSAFNVPWTALGAVAKPDATITGLVRGGEAEGSGEDGESGGWSSC